MVVAAAEIGVHEYAGAASNPRILEYYKATLMGGAPEDGSTPWCAAFVSWVLEKSGYRGPRTTKARRFLSYGQMRPEPEFGDIAVLWREDPQSEKGHVAFFVAKKADSQVWLLGGNQGNQVSYQLYGTGRVLGYRRPSDADRKVG